MNEPVVRPGQPLFFSSTPTDSANVLVTFTNNRYQIQYDLYRIDEIDSSTGLLFISVKSGKVRKLKLSKRPASEVKIIGPSWPRIRVTARRWRFYLDPLFPSRPIEPVYSYRHADSFYWIPCKGGAVFPAFPPGAVASSSIIRLYRQPGHLTNVSFRFHIAAYATARFFFYSFQPLPLLLRTILVSQSNLSNLYFHTLFFFFFQNC